jgi:signal transduction histidine kinase
LARLIRNTNSPEEINQYALLQEKSLLKLDNFIRDILNYSRNSRVEVKSEIIDFHQIINEVIAENQYITPDFKIRFFKNIKEEVSFYSDPLRIRIILNNLISNAVKFQNKYQAEPTVRIEINADAQKAVITVADNGIGIGKDHFDRIFEMFYRATDKSNGSGIGLYITRDCVEKIGGSITFFSEYGQGSEFRVEVPFIS